MNGRVDVAALNFISAYADLKAGATRPYFPIVFFSFSPLFFLTRYRWGFNIGPSLERR
jgi:hypothetical protein